MNTEYRSLFKLQLVHHAIKCEFHSTIGKNMYARNYLIWPCFFKVFCFAI